MKKNYIKINDIPSIIWGEESKKVFIAVHGNFSNKEDTVIEMLANNAIKQNYQVLSFDLPEHGDRTTDGSICKVQYAIKDLEKIIEYAKENWSNLNLFGCSIGAYFSMLAYNNEMFNNCLFLSPVIDMKLIIENMMKDANVTPKILEEKQEIKTEFNQILYWDYYEYIKNHPIIKWNNPTKILFGEKDNLTTLVTIRSFSKKFNCNLEIVENAEHFFHTEKQLTTYKKWLEENIK